MIDISLPNLLLAGTFVETLTVILVYFNNNKGKYITKWYNNLRIGAILLDILSAIVPVLFALLINNNFIIQSGIIILIELIHDITFGSFLIKYKGTSEVLNIFKGYAKKDGHKILFYDQIILISVLLFYYLLDYLNLNYKIISLIGFILLYITIMFVYSF